MYFCWYRQIDSAFVHLDWDPIWLVIKQLFWFYPGLNRTRIWKGRYYFSLCLFFINCYAFQSDAHYCFIIIQSPDFRISSLLCHFCKIIIYFLPLSPVADQCRWSVLHAREKILATITKHIRKQRETWPDTSFQCITIEVLHLLYAFLFREAVIFSLLQLTNLFLSMNLWKTNVSFLIMSFS